MDAPALIVLPPNETFGPLAAGAIALIVERLARGVPGTVVLGAAKPVPAFEGIDFRPLTARSRLGYRLAALRAIAQSRARVVEIHQEPRLALLAARLFARRRVSLFLHNDPTAMRGLKRPAARRAALRRLHRVVCVSDYLARLFGAGAQVLPNPIELARLPPRAAPRTREILFAGRITADKGADLFVAACAAALPRLPGWRARMIGGDRFGLDSPRTPFVARIEAAAAAAGIATTGYRPHGDVLDAMAAAEIVVMPSRMIEGFPMIALEALASGAALIAAPSGGLPEVSGDTALYVPPGDAAALAEAIVLLAADDAGRAARQAAGRARAERFDLPPILERLATLRAG